MKCGENQCFTATACLPLGVRWFISSNHSLTLAVAPMGSTVSGIYQVLSLAWLNVPKTKHKWETKFVSWVLPATACSPHLACLSHFPRLVFIYASAPSMSANVLTMLRFSMTYIKLKWQNNEDSIEPFFFLDTFMNWKYCNCLFAVTKPNTDGNRM